MRLSPFPPARLDSTITERVGSRWNAATPDREQRNTARVPDALVRYKGLLRVMFEVASPSELQRLKERDGKRQDVKEVESVAEIVEIYQHAMAVHVHSRIAGDLWSFSSINGADKSLAVVDPRDGKTRYLRVVALADGVTIHNAFFDPDFDGVLP